MSWFCVLYNEGAKYTYAITRKGHIHRLILPIILHVNFFHIFWNVLSLLSIGFTIEKALGRWYYYFFLILLSGMGGCMFSAIVKTDSISVGASGVLYGLIGALVSWVYMNWRFLEPIRIRYLIFMGFIVIFTIINDLTMPMSNIDGWGHFGGLIFGFFISAFMLKPWLRML